MSDTASSSRPGQPSPVSDEPGKVRADQTPSPIVAPPEQDDQPTIISHRAPMVTPAASDSAYRILQGKIVPGDRLGHFELVQYVGGGGMGRVFRGVDSHLGRSVALKILSPEQAADRETLLRFHNEAQSAARLDHENIARVYHVGEDRGLNYIVFEFIEGINIRALVERKGPLPLAEAVSYTLQIAEALCHADARNVVHRDVKPSNVLITPEGHVKLIDMGLARLRHENASAADLTASGVTLGTFDYISPEQARDPRNADVRSDIYSLGCSFFYMLAGRPPFPEGTVLQKLLQHQGDQPPDVREFRPELPDEAARVLRKMLAKDPGHRYHDPQDLVEDLMLLAEQVGLEPVGRSRRMWVAPRHRVASFFNRHLPWIAPVAALVCVVMLLHFLSRQDDQAPPPSPWPAPQVVQPHGPELPAAGPDEPSPKTVPGDDQPAPPAGANGEQPPPAVVHGGGVQVEPPPSDVLAQQGSTDLLDLMVAGRTDSAGLEFDSIRGGVSVGGGPFFRISLVPDAGASSSGLNGAEGILQGPSEVGPAEDPVPQRSRLLVVVDEQTEGANEYLTLGAACRAARDGDVIELRYDGRRDEEPIKLTKLGVTIQAGRDQAGEDHHPVVVFRPGEDDVDPMKYPRSMFNVTAGRLTLINVALELHVPRVVSASHWTLFEIHGGQTVRLERCSLTICNASDQMGAGHQDVAFFRTQSAPGADALTADDTATTTPLATIDLLDSIARGEAAFLRATDLQPIHLVWENGLLVTTEQLVAAGGGQEIPRIGEMLMIDLRHVTAVVGGGLCRISGSQLTPHQLVTQIHCADSILVAAADAPLIEQVGMEGGDDLRQLILWSGSRVFYEDFTVFWSILGIDREPLSDPAGFEAWRSWWANNEQQPSEWLVNWRKRPETNRAMHTHDADDYALAESTEGDPNPAIGTAPHGRNAGFQADRLPALPAWPVVEEPLPAAASDD